MRNFLLRLYNAHSINFGTEPGYTLACTLLLATFFSGCVMLMAMFPLLVPLALIVIVAACLGYIISKLVRDW